MKVSTFVARTHRISLNEEYIKNIQRLHNHRGAQILMYLSLFVDNQNNVHLLSSVKQFICESLRISNKTFDNNLSKLIRLGNIQRIDRNLLHLEAPFYIISEPKYFRRIRKTVLDL